VCNFWDTSCVADSVAVAVADSVFGQLTGVVVTAEQWLIDTTASWWVMVPSISLYPGAGNQDPGAAPIDTVAHLRGLMLPITVLVAMGGMIWNGILMTLSRKPAPLVNVLRGLWNTALWSAVGIFGTNLLLYGTDQLSNAILGAALHSVGNPSFAKRLDAQLVPVTGAVGGLPPGIVFAIATIGMICSFVQALLMLFRDGSVLILAPCMPLAASGSFANATNGWLRKVMTWQLALIFYKPAASMVYATAIWLQGENTSTDPRVMLMGLAMLIIALVALPVLLRFFTWTVGSLQTGGGGLGLLATAAAGGMHAGATMRSSAGDHARYINEVFDRGGAGGGRAGGGGAPTGSGGGGPGPGPGRPPTFVGPSSSAGAAPAAGGAAGGAGSAAMAGSAAAGPAAPVAMATIGMVSTATQAAKGAAHAAANAPDDSTKGG
jgi:hypothetical protein